MVLDECIAQWQLRLGEPYAPGAAGYAVRAELPDGTPAVLKLSNPHREAEQEADALERWNGDGAVRLLARDDARNALLLERCEPGTFLSQSPDALDVLIGLLPRLWKDAVGFHTLADEAEWWAENLPRECSDRSLLDPALHYIRELAPTQAAEREFAASSIVRSFELGHSKRDVLHRLDRVTSELGLDRDRALGWTVAQTVAWSGGSDYVDRHVETVRWLLEES